MEKIPINFEKALDMIGGSANLGAFSFWTANQGMVFPNLTFVYTDGEAKEYLEKKWLIGIRIAGLLMGCECPPPGESYKKVAQFLKDYRTILPLLPENMTCRVSTFEELETLYPFRDEISLALLLMGKPVLKGKYWSSSFIEKTDLVKIFDFEKGGQSYNGVTRKDCGQEELSVLPILKNKIS